MQRSLETKTKPLPNQGRYWGVKMEHELFTLFIRSGARQERSSVLCAQLVAQQSPDVCVSATGGIFLKSSNYPLLSSFLVKKRKKKEEEGGGGGGVGAEEEDNEEEEEEEEEEDDDGRKDKTKKR